MDLFSRYLFRQTGSAFLLVMTTLTLIIWMSIALKELDLLTSQGQSLGLFLSMTALAVPNIVALIAPTAFLVAALYSLDRFNGDSELIVMSASGAPIWHFAKPLLALAALLAVLLVALTFYLAPLSLRTLQAYVVEVRSDLISQVLSPGRFSSPEQGLTFHIRDRAPNNDLLGLIVHDSRTEGRAMTYLAKRGHIITTDEGAFLIMKDGQIHRRLDEGKSDSRDVNIGEFKEYIFDISQFEPNEGPAEIKARERYISELLNPDENDSYYQRAAGRLRSELHSRFADLLYPFVYAIITLNFLGHARTVREPRWKSISLAFGTSVLVRIFGIVATNLLTLKASAVVLVYGIPLGAILVAAIAANARMSPSTRFRLNREFPGWLRPPGLLHRIASGVRTEQHREHAG